MDNPALLRSWGLGCAVLGWVNAWGVAGCAGCEQELVLGGGGGCDGCEDGLLLGIDVGDVASLAVAAMEPSRETKSAAYAEPAEGQEEGLCEPEGDNSSRASGAGAAGVRIPGALGPAAVVSGRGWRKRLGADIAALKEGGLAAGTVVDCCPLL